MIFLFSYFLVVPRGRKLFLNKSGKTNCGIFIQYVLNDIVVYEAKKNSEI